MPRTVAGDRGRGGGWRGVPCDKGDSVVATPSKKGGWEGEPAIRALRIKEEGLDLAGTLYIMITVPLHAEWMPNIFAIRKEPNQY